MTKINTHCQICGRAIKTVVGYSTLGNGVVSDTMAGRTDRIAHHGFTRPHQQGWQSGSCFGARWRPYEVACDALPPAIKGIEGFIARQRIALAKFTLEPPAKLQYDKARGGFRNKAEMVDVPRPEGFVFDENRKLHQTAYRGYEYLYVLERTRFLASIKGGEDDLAVMQKRLADWKAPTEAVS